MESSLESRREKILADAVNEFKGGPYFSDDRIIRATCGGILDLLSMPDKARDMEVVGAYAERIKDMTKNKSGKTGMAVEFLERLEDIVARHDPEGEKQASVFFEICRECLK